MSTNAVVWKDAHRASVAKLFQEVWRTRTIGGLRFGVELNIYLRAMVAHACVPIDVRLLQSAILDLPMGVTPALTALEEQVRKLAAKSAKAKECAPVWTLTLPATIRFDAPRCGLFLRTRSAEWLITTSQQAVNAHVAQRSSWTAGIESAVRYIQNSTLFRNPLAVIRATGVKGDERDSISRALADLDVLRGIIEYSLSAFSWTWMGSGMPRRRFHVGDYVLASSSDARSVAFTLHWPTSTAANWSPAGWMGYPIGRRRAKAIKYLADLVCVRPEGSVYELLADALRLYANALDQVLLEQRTVGFWQVAECLTLAVRHRGDTRIVCKRLSLIVEHVGEFPEAVATFLQAVANARNEYVHKASGEMDEDDCNALKYLCDHAIRWLVRQARAIQTTERLETVYRLANEDIESVRLAANVLAVQRGARP